MGEHQPLWTDDEVTSLNDFQLYGMMHPFTCPNRGDSPHRTSKADHGALVATPDGWRCPDCAYRQDWAHPWMLDRSWEASANETRRMMRMPTVADAKRDGELSQRARDWIDATHGRHVAYQWLKGDGAAYLDPAVPETEVRYPTAVLDRESAAFGQAFADTIKGVAWHVANPGKLCFAGSDCPDLDWVTRGR